MSRLYISSPDGRWGTYGERQGARWRIEIAHRARGRGRWREILWCWGNSRSEALALASRLLSVIAPQPGAPTAAPKALVRGRRRHAKGHQG